MMKTVEWFEENWREFLKTEFISNPERDPLSMAGQDSLQGYRPPQWPYVG
jgi:hypothetical protein